MGATRTTARVAVSGAVAYVHADGDALQHVHKTRLAWRFDANAAKVNEVCLRGGLHRLQQPPSRVSHTRLCNVNAMGKLDLDAAVPRREHLQPRSDSKQGATRLVLLRVGTKHRPQPRGRARGVGLDQIPLCHDLRAKSGLIHYIGAKLTSPVASDAVFIPSPASLLR